MPKIFSSILALLSLTILLSSCAKVGPTGPTGPAGPAYTGNISGHAILFDQYGNRLLSDLDSVSLTLGGQSIAIHPDNTGYFNYPNLATGEYNITATATGYGATYTNSFQFLGGTLNRDVKLSAIPTYSITSVTATTGPAYDTIVINCAADPLIRSFIIFAGSSASVSNVPAGYLLAFVKNIPANLTKVTTVITADELHNAGFASGTTVYYAVYSADVNDQSVYEDVASGNNVYNAVSNPLTVSTAAP